MNLKEMIETRSTEIQRAYDIATERMNLLDSDVTRLNRLLKHAINERARISNDITAIKQRAIELGVLNIL